MPMPIVFRFKLFHFNLSRYQAQYRRSFMVAIALVAVLLTTSACSGNRNRTAEKIAEDSKQVEEFDNSLSFNDLTLEGFDKKGQLWWKVKAKRASYSKDKKLAQIQQPTGELYQDGKAVVQVSADAGEVQQDGQNIFLKGKIKAVDKRNGMVLTGNELEWQPAKDLLIVRNNVTGNYQQTNVAAKGGRFFTRAKRLELEGNVTAVSQKPNAQFQSERVVWLVEQKTLTSDRPLQIVGALPGRTVQDQATAGQGVVDLKTKTATLKQNTRINLSDPPIQVAGELLVWNLNAKTVVSDQPVTIYNPRQRVTLTANQGRLETTSKMAYLTGNVRGNGQRNQSALTSDRLTYNLGSQEFLAEGNVTYQQANPPFNLAGPRATGKLQDQTVVVSGGRVVTEFIPDTVVR